MQEHIWHHLKLHFTCFVHLLPCNLDWNLYFARVQFWEQSKRHNCSWHTKLDGSFFSIYYIWLGCVHIDFLIDKECPRKSVEICTCHKPQMSRITTPNVYIMHIWQCDRHLIGAILNTTSEWHQWIWLVGRFVVYDGQMWPRLYNSWVFSTQSYNLWLMIVIYNHHSRFQSIFLMFMWMRIP